MEAILSRVPVKYAKRLPVDYVITNGRTWTASEWREWYKSVKFPAFYRMWVQRKL